jgi:hypothetical protein
MEDDFRYKVTKECAEHIMRVLKEENEGARVKLASDLSQQEKRVLRLLIAHDESDKKIKNYIVKQIQKYFPTINVCFPIYFRSFKVMKAFYNALGLDGCGIVNQIRDNARVEIPSNIDDVKLFYIMQNNLQNADSELIDAIKKENPEIVDTFHIFQVNEKIKNYAYGKVFCDLRCILLTSPRAMSNYRKFGIKACLPEIYHELAHIENGDVEVGLKNPSNRKFLVLMALLSSPIMFLVHLAQINKISSNNCARSLAIYIPAAFIAGFINVFAIDKSCELDADAVMLDKCIAQNNLVSAVLWFMYCIKRYEQDNKSSANLSSIVKNYFFGSHPTLYTRAQLVLTKLHQAQLDLLDLKLEPDLQGNTDLQQKFNATIKKYFPSIYAKALKNHQEKMGNDNSMPEKSKKFMFSACALGGLTLAVLAYLKNKIIKVS